MPVLNSATPVVLMVKVALANTSTSGVRSSTETLPPTLVAWSVVLSIHVYHHFLILHLVLPRR